MANKRSAPPANDDIEIRAQADGEALNKSDLVSTLNQFSFRQDPIALQLTSPGSREGRRIQVVPQLCDQEAVTCTYLHDPASPPQPRPGDDTVAHIQIQEGKKLIVAKPRQVEFKEGRVRLVLPDAGYQILTRKTRRRACYHITAHMELEDNTATGTLVDFHAFSFACSFASAALQKDLLGCECRMTLLVDGKPVFQGGCRITRHTRDGSQAWLVMSPSSRNAPVLKPKTYRGDRVRPVPVPGLRFRHPLTGQSVYLDIVELSGSGFAVQEYGDQAVLVPGLRIPEAHLELTQIFSFRCAIRVIHRTALDGSSGDADGVSRVGCMIESMGMKNHAQLVSYLQHAKDPRAFTCAPPDMQALWEFFFSTGFIYPEKYRYVFANREKIKATFDKLYSRGTDVSRHFIVQDKGLISGHIALHWSYSRTWMIHHFAARKEARLAGPKVLNQIGNFMLNSLSLETNHMQYVIVYYRPDNKFPSRVFGGMARQVKDPQNCSLDTFAYFHVHRPATDPGQMDSTYRLVSTCQADLDGLQQVYRQATDGLMLKALDLTHDPIDDTHLRKACRAADLRRDRYLFTLRQEDRPVAVIMVGMADIGVNLSDLTNCMHVFVLEPQKLPPAPLQQALASLARLYDQPRVAVNLFPDAYADTHSLEIEKRYTLWAIRCQYSDIYFDYLKRLSRFFRP